MSGAFDRLGPHRAALMNSLGDALKAADQHAKAEAIGQADMFGVLAEEPEQIEQSYASCQPWPEQVVLDGERETLGLYLTGHPINQYLKEIERYVGGVRLKDMHPTERGKVITAAGLVVAARVMVTKRGNRIGICTLDDRSGRLEVMLFTDALDKYQQLLEKDRILIVSGQVSFDDFSGGLKMTAREVMDIDEAREKYARGLAISLTDRQIDDQLLNRLRQSLEPHRSGTIPVHLYYQRADARARNTMSLNFLDFEQPIAELEAKIDSLTAVSRQDEKLDINIDEEVHRLREKSIAQLARHPQRPYTLDYVRLAFDEFDELAGDRAYADDKAIVGGIARLDGRPVMIIGHQKGRETKEKIRRNFGMPAPEGYRKALRLMQMAERFKMPIITFIDTPGAYPGVGAEERGQSEAIARNLREMSRLSVPTICTVIGEGGSGGALAIGVGDKVNMLQYSTYSVISPEGCASILWKSADKAPLAAEAMGIIAPRLKELKLIDSIIPEPLGGAHRNPEAMAASLKAQLLADLADLDVLSTEDLKNRRYQRLMSYGYA
uniref:acetyl-CoA carboxytransferase n=1 Tax=Panagrolaimus superbus TaxID=310955 RepID=A0A914Y570_9BILA